RDAGALGAVVLRHHDCASEGQRAVVDAEDGFQSIEHAPADNFDQRHDTEILALDHVVSETATVRQDAAGKIPPVDSVCRAAKWDPAFELAWEAHSIHPPVVQQAWFNAEVAGPQSQARIARREESAKLDGQRTVLLGDHGPLGTEHNVTQA